MKTEHIKGLADDGGDNEEDEVDENRVGEE